MVSSFRLHGSRALCPLEDLPDDQSSLAPSLTPNGASLSCGSSRGSPRSRTFAAAVALLPSPPQCQ